MTQAAQVDDEMRWITAMIDLLGLEIQGIPDKQEPPRPDFRFQLVDGTHISVEVVEATDQSVREGYAGARVRIVRQVSDAMKHRGLVANVSLSFPVGYVAVLGDLEGKKTRAMGARIVDLVAEALATELPPGQHGWLYEDRDPDDPPDKYKLHHAGDLSSRGIDYVGWIAIHPSSELAVLTAAGGMGPGAHLIQEAIDRKAAKRGSYDVSGTNEFWLLVVGSTGAGGSLDVHVTERRTFTSPFDRTIFLECFEKKCVVLETKGLGGT